MPSLLVHFAVSGMIAAALLGDAFDERALLVVFAVTAFPDVDSFIALVSTVGHRAALHNVWIPIGLAVLLYADLEWRDRSFVRERWGPWGVRVAWVSVLCYVLSAIAFDLVTGLVNPFWPVHDQYYAVDGKIELSSQRGLVQTMVELGSDGADQAQTRSYGSSQEVNLSTGVNPAPDSEPETVDHVLPVVRSGWQLVVLLVGTAVTAARFLVDQSVTGE